MHWDTGNIAFMLVSTSLVMLMTPGLAFFYGGLVGRKNVLAIMTQSFVSMGVTTVLWVVCGYSMCFSGSYHSATNPDILGVIGNFNLAFFNHVDPMTPFPGSPTIPTACEVRSCTMNRPALNDPKRARSVSGGSLAVSGSLR